MFYVYKISKWQLHINVSIKHDKNPRLRDKILDNGLYLIGINVYCWRT